MWQNDTEINSLCCAVISLADDASDSANYEQLAIILSCLTTNSEPQEKFLSFILPGVSGEALAGNILKHLSDQALDLTFQRGQAYNMMEQVQLQAVLEELQCINFPKRVMHCTAHHLYLCVVKCCSIHEIRYCRQCC